MVGAVMKCRFKRCDNEAADGKKTCPACLKAISKNRTGRKKRHYNDEERGLILTVYVNNNCDAERTSRETGCPAPTIKAWANGWRYPDAMSLYQDKAGHLAKAAEEIAWKIAAIIPKKLDDAPLNHLSTSFGIMVDKTRILMGLPTVINQDKTDTSNEELKELLRWMSPDDRDNFRRALENAAERREQAATLPLPHPAIQPVPNPPSISNAG